MERKKKRFEQMRARMLAGGGASFQNAPPPSFQNAAPPAAVAANEKRASTSEQSAPPPPAVTERTRQKRLRFDNLADRHLAQIVAGRQPDEHFNAVNDCLDIIRKLPDRFAWVEFAKTDDIQRKQHWFCAFGLDAIQTTRITLKAAGITYAYPAFCKLHHQCRDLADGTANYFTQHPQWLVALWKVGEVHVQSRSFQFRTLLCMLACNFAENPHVT
jgi:hypothetical protein